jgi:hypothetical protein
MSLSEVEGSTVATTSDVQPVTQTEGIQPQTSDAGNTGETAAPESEQGKPDTPEKKESRFKRRLDRAKADAAYWRGVAEARGHTEAPSKSQAAPEAGKEPKREDYESYEDFIVARAEYRAERKAEERISSRERESRETQTRESQSREQKRLEETWNASLDKAREELDDYDEVTSESEAPTTPHMTRAIMESDIGAKIAYHLAKHPEDAARIAKLSPVRQIAEIGKLEDKVSQAKPAPRKPSSAPDPIAPNKGTAPAAKSIFDPDISQEEYNRLRREQRGRR